MRADSAVTWPETIEVLISQLRLQTLRSGTQTRWLRGSNASCWQQILMLELAETVRMYRVHYVHWCSIMIQQLSWFYNNFLDSSSNGQKISSQRSWWLSTGQHRKAAEHPFPHDLLLPALLNKVNANAKSDWIEFCELHILAKSTSGDPANWTSSTWKWWKGDSTGIIWNTLRSLYDHQIVHRNHTSSSQE